MTQHKQSHRIQWHDQHIKWHDMTCHVATYHSSSPHVTSQPSTLLHLTPQATSWHQNRSHHHHGTAKGSFTAKEWFGHRAGRSPFARSTGKFFLWLIVFSLKLPPPACPGTTGMMMVFSDLDPTDSTGVLQILSDHSISVKGTLGHGDIGVGVGDSGAAPKTYRQIGWRDQCFKSCSCVLTHCLCFSIREYVFLEFCWTPPRMWIKDEFFLVSFQKIFRKRTTHCLCFRCKVPLEGGIWNASPHVLRCMLLALRQKPKHPPFNPSCNPSFTRSRVHVGDFENVERSLCLHLILGDMERIEGQWVRMQGSVGASCSWGALVDSFLVMQRSKEPCISWFRLGRKSKGPKIIVRWFEWI